MIEPPPERTLGHTTVLFGENGGKYPQGNSIVVAGTEESLILDPSLGMIPRREQLPPVDRVVNSHSHEDHFAGNHLFPGVPWHIHELDALGLRSLEDMMTVYGYDEAAERYMRRALVEEYHYAPRPDALTFSDGHVFDLGGVRMTAIHTPGHTRGHTCFRIEPDDVLCLGDIDLSSFGPYYGDAWSSLEDFEKTLDVVRRIEARWYATFHHIGIVEGREAFLERLDRFAAVIAKRESRLLEFLRQPRTIEEIVGHRFVYRPQDAVPFADPVEKRSMGFHLERLAREGRAREIEPGRWLAD
ncbi:MAG: hypothetical protein QOD06_1258 [Candidatus Binatota bacterium]|nr:hypothetical protein [Candidatus Binatota bacterium]